MEEKVAKILLTSLRLLKVTSVEIITDLTNEEVNGQLIVLVASSLTKLKAEQEEMLPHKKNAETGTLDEIPKVSALNAIALAEKAATVSYQEFSLK